MVTICDIVHLNETFRAWWSTRRMMQSDPVATIVRYTDMPNPELIFNDYIYDSRLNIVEDILDRILVVSYNGSSTNFIVTNYTSNKIYVSVVGGGLLDRGYLDSLKENIIYTIAPLKQRKLESPTKVQLLEVDGETLIDRPVAWFKLKNEELVKYSTALTIKDRKFIFYDLEVLNSDVIILKENSQDLESTLPEYRYEVYTTEYYELYKKCTVYGRAIYG